MGIYDRSYSLPVILDLSALKQADFEEFLDYLNQNHAKELRFPMDSALDQARELSSRGWPSFAKSLPFDVSSTETMQLFARTIKAFNPNSLVRRDPDSSRMNRRVEKPDDFGRLIEELLLQQDNISLSAIFKTAERDSEVYWTRRSTPLSGRLSKNVVIVSRPLGKKGVEERNAYVTEQIAFGLERARQEDLVRDNKPTDANFRYR